MGTVIWMDSKLLVRAFQVVASSKNGRKGFTGRGLEGFCTYGCKDVDGLQLKFLMQTNRPVQAAT
jgi:hypothetical protein